MALRLEHFDLQLPHGSVSASGRLRLGETPGLAAAIAVQDVDFDALPVPAGRGVWPWPAPWLTGRDLDVRVDLRRCVAGGLPLTDAHAALRMRLRRVAASGCSSAPSV